METARKLSLRHLRAEPASPLALLVVGLVAKKRLQIEDAIPLLERSVRIAPSRNALASLADCLWRVGRLESGLGYVEQVIAGSPGNPESLLLMAAIRHGHRRFDEALECARRAERMAPQSDLVAARLTPGFPYCSLVNFRASVWRRNES